MILLTPGSSDHGFHRSILVLGKTHIYCVIIDPPVNYYITAWLQLSKNCSCLDLLIELPTSCK